MFRIVKKQDFSPIIHLFEIEAPAIARKAQPGQFVVVRKDEYGERIPLTIADWDKERGTITLIFLEAGTETALLGTLKEGDFIADVVGPLGLPSHIEVFGTVVCVGGGVGIAAIYPIVRALKQVGNKVISIIGARTKSLLFWEEKISTWSDEVIITTDDGSYARKGVVTEPLREILEKGIKIDRVIAIGPAIMMKFCSLTTQPFGVKTIVSLNPIMVDGTGMCGCCRVEVGGRTRFACLHGPEFDAHQVNWDLLLARLRTYIDKEKASFEIWQKKLQAIK